MIGFAGKRVIEQTIREKLPGDFQTAEYLLDHGMIDMVTHRADLRAILIRIIDLLCNTGPSGEVVALSPLEDTPDDLPPPEQGQDEGAPATKDDTSPPV